MKRTWMSITAGLPPWWRNRLWETAIWARDLLRSSTSSYTGHLNLDRALEQAINPEIKGFFIEAGAANGISQSPTLKLERTWGWRGALVEPHPHQARLAKIARKSRVYARALTSREYQNSTIVLNAAGLMGTVGKKVDAEAFSIQALSPESFEVATMNLSQLLAKGQVSREPFRLLVLDLEGYELEVLKDIPALEQKPEFICVETVSFGIEDVANLIGVNFDFVKWLTAQDTLWKAKTYRP